MPGTFLLQGDYFYGFRLPVYCKKTTYKGARYLLTVRRLLLRVPGNFLLQGDYFYRYKLLFYCKATTSRVPGTFKKTTSTGIRYFFYCKETTSTGAGYLFTARRLLQRV